MPACCCSAACSLCCRCSAGPADLDAAVQRADQIRVAKLLVAHVVDACFVW